MPFHQSQYDFVPSNTVQMHDFDAGRLLDLLLFFGLFLLYLSLGLATEVLKQRSDELFCQRKVENLQP